ncbi:MAG: hypothetical protein KY469_06610 [Actinobacteria bacterium]|nr:hypothetical protein [Actinomycetota bacterium]
MNELLFPRTDAGVLVQVVVLAAIVATALWRTWANPDLRLLVVGSGLLGFALMGLRAAH